MCTGGDDCSLVVVRLPGDGTGPSPRPVFGERRLGAKVVLRNACREWMEIHDGRLRPPAPELNRSLAGYASSRRVAFPSAHNPQGAGVDQAARRCWCEYVGRASRPGGQPGRPAGCFEDDPSNAEKIAAFAAGTSAAQAAQATMRCSSEASSSIAGSTLPVPTGDDVDEQPQPRVLRRGSSIVRRCWMKPREVLDSRGEVGRSAATMGALRFPRPAQSDDLRCLSCSCRAERECLVFVSHASSKLRELSPSATVAAFCHGRLVRAVPGPARVPVRVLAGPFPVRVFRVDAVGGLSGEEHARGPSHSSGAQRRRPPGDKTVERRRRGRDG